MVPFSESYEASVEFRGRPVMLRLEFLKGRLVGTKLFTEDPASLVEAIGLDAELLLETRLLLEAEPLELSDNVRVWVHHKDGAPFVAWLDWRVY